jgi:hypothetical protein
MRRLKTLVQVRHALSYIWREIDADRMDTQKGRTLIYLCAVLKTIIEGDEYEKRLEEIERRLDIQ